MNFEEQRALNILLIEDNPGDVRLVQEMFKQCAPHVAANVCAVARLEHGLERLAEEKVDVVLLDLSLPDSEGIETFLKVQQHSPCAPVIVLTGLRDDETASRSLRDGAQDYLIKGQIDADRMLRSVRYAIERKRAEEQLRAVTDVQRLLLSELDHRVRNNLASLLSLIDFGARQYRDVNHFADSMRNRVQTMATVHTLLSRSQWTSICLDRLLRSLIENDFQDRITLQGPKVTLPVQQVHAFGMVMHELLTNSIKYGSLSNDSGTLTITWTVDPPKLVVTDDHSEAVSHTLRLEWIEQGGPKVSKPASTGIGTKIISGLAESELSGSIALEYPPDGVHHRLRAVLVAENGIAAISRGPWPSDA